MKNLLVLCGDNRMVNEKPLVTMRYPDGKIIAEKVIEGIFPETYDRVLFAIPASAEETYGVGSEIMKSLGTRYPIEIVALHEQTNNPAETAYRTIQMADVDGEIAIRDSNNYILLERAWSGNFIAGLNLMHYERPIDGLCSKSFILINEQHQVLDIVEKHLRSDVVSCGLYGFKNVNSFVMAYEKLEASHGSIKKLYISHIISYLIGYSKDIFYSARVLDFEDWKTPYAWSFLQRRHSICFINLSMLGGKGDSPDEEVIKIMRKMSQTGNVLVGYLREECDQSEILRYMEAQGVKMLSIVTGCGYSNACRVIDKKTELKRVAVEEC